jgi:hypothetical protein
MTFEELLESVMNVERSYDTDEYVELTELLHRRMNSVENLVPLLTSSMRSCQSMGVFIAAMEGSAACRIFEHILPLLESPYVEIRDDACDCFTACGGRPEDLIKLVRHLYDPEARIRVKVIQVLLWLESEKIIALESHLARDGAEPDIHEGLSLLSRHADPCLSDEIIESAISEGAVVVRKFAYMTAFRRFSSNEELRRLVGLSNDEDISMHFEIYSERKHMISEHAPGRSSEDCSSAE